MDKFMSNTKLMVRVEEYEGNTTTTYENQYDLFDNLLYENFLKNNLNLKVTKNIIRVGIYRFIESKLLYENIPYCHDNLTNKKIDSIPCFDKERENKLKLPLRKKLRNIYKNPKPEIQTNFIDEISMNKDEKNNKLSICKDYSSNEAEKTLCNLQLSKRNSKMKVGGYRSTLSIYTKNTEYLKNDPSNFSKKMDTETVEKILDDSKFLPYNITNRNTRPPFLDKLFKKYNYEDIEYPDKKIQNKTKVKALNLGVIREIYSKLCNWINN